MSRLLDFPISEFELRIVDYTETSFIKNHS
jgi:hypothetical protein